MGSQIPILITAPTHRDLITPGSPRLAALPSRSSLSGGGGGGGSIRSPSPLLTPRSLSSLGGAILPSGSPLLDTLPSLSPLGGPSLPDKATPVSPLPLRNPSSLSSFSGGPSLPDKTPPSPLLGPSLSPPPLSGGPSRPDNLIETPSSTYSQSRRTQHTESSLHQCPFS